MPNPTPAKLQVDFSNVGDRTEGGGKAAHVPEGDYLVRVVACELRKKKDDETSKYLSWKLAIVKPSKYSSSGFIYFITSLNEESLWNLRNFLEDLGLKVPKSAVNIPILKIVEEKRTLGVTVEDDEYNNKVKSKVSATFKAEAFEETAEAASDSDEEGKPTGAAKSEDDEDSEDEDLEEIDVADL